MIYNLKTAPDKQGFINEHNYPLAIIERLDKIIDLLEWIAPPEAIMVREEQE